MPFNPLKILKLLVKWGSIARRYNHSIILLQLSYFCKWRLILIRWMCFRLIFIHNCCCGQSGWHYLKDHWHTIRPYLFLNKNLHSNFMTKFRKKLVKFWLKISKCIFAVKRSIFVWFENFKKRHLQSYQIKLTICLKFM